jgi:hypothetical protein
MGSKKGILITVASMAVAIIVAMATIQSTQASIDYWLDKPDAFIRGLNQISVHCNNGGGMDGDFNLILTFTNASISNQTEQPYIKVDNSTVKLKFVLHKGDATEQTVCFNVDGVAGFSVKVTLERTNFLQFWFLKENSLFPTKLAYCWNGETSNFTNTNSS